MRVPKGRGVIDGDGDVRGEHEEDGEPVRLAFGPFLWRSFAILALTGELALWVAIQRRGRGFPPGIRLAWMIGHTPRILLLSFVLAAILTVLVDLFVRLVIGAQLRRWLTPRTERDDDSGSGLGTGFGFHLDATERVVDSLPARRLSRWQSEPGSLVLTDRRVWFFPSAWDGDPWSVPRDRVRSAALEPASGPIGGLVRGLPPHLTLETGADSGDESRDTFALADPLLARSWFVTRTAGSARPA